jgi:hypothetical protein
MTVANGASAQTSLIADPWSLSPPKKDATVDVFMAKHLATARTMTDSAETEETKEESTHTDVRFLQEETRSEGESAQGEAEIAEIIGGIIMIPICCGAFGWCFSVAIKRNKELSEIERLAKKLKDSENMPAADLRVVIGDVRAELDAQPPRSYLPPASKKLQDSEALPEAELPSVVREVYTELQAQTHKEREANKGGKA